MAGFNISFSGREDIKQIVDRDGHSLPALDLNGRYLIPMATKVWWDSMTAVEARDDDIIVASYPKTGNHWLFEITRYLVNKTTDLSPANLQTDSIDTGVLSVQDIGNLPSTRVLSTHRLFHELPYDAVRRRCKIVYIERNVKDVAVSFYNMMKGFANLNYEGTFPAYAELFLRGEVIYNSFFDTVKHWRKFIQENPDYPIHYMTYEKLKGDPVGEISRLAVFLGVEPDPGLIKDIAQKTDFKVLKKQKDKEVAASNFYRQLFRGPQNNLYRKGEVADWKNWFTVALSEQFDAEFRRQMGHEFADDDFLTELQQKFKM